MSLFHDNLAREEIHRDSTLQT